MCPYVKCCGDAPVGQGTCAVGSTTKGFNRDALSRMTVALRQAIVVFTVPHVAYEAFLQYCQYCMSLATTQCKCKRNFPRRSSDRSPSDRSSVCPPTLGSIQSC